MLADAMQQNYVLIYEQNDLKTYLDINETFKLFAIFNNVEFASFN